jgi:hypothetical protein
MYVLYIYVISMYIIYLYIIYILDYMDPFFDREGGGLNSVYHGYYWWYQRTLHGEH